MGIFDRLFESSKSKADRLVREAAELSTKTSAERAVLMARVKPVLENAKTVVAGNNNLDWLAFQRELREVVPKAASFVQLHRQDHSFALISCLLTSMGLAADAFDQRGVAHLIPRDIDAEARLTITTLSVMAEHPECLDDIRQLAGANALSRLQLRSGDVAHVMGVYEALWQEFVYDKHLVCPLDVGGASASVRAYLTSRGGW